MIYQTFLLSRMMEAISSRETIMITVERTLKYKENGSMGYHTVYAMLSWKTLAESSHSIMGEWMEGLDGLNSRRLVSDIHLNMLTARVKFSKDVLGHITVISLQLMSIALKKKYLHLDG